MVLFFLNWASLYLTLFNSAFNLTQWKTKINPETFYFKGNKGVSLIEVKQISKCTTGFYNIKGLSKFT